MAIRREFKSKYQEKKFRKDNHLILARELEVIIFGTYYQTKKTPKILKENPKFVWGKPED